MAKTQSNLTAYVCTDEQGYPETIKARLPTRTDQLGDR